MVRTDRGVKLEDLPPPWAENVLAAIREEIGRSERRPVFLDDDPTGTQTSHGVLVLTEWSEAELAAGLREAGPALFVLTNSRSLPEVDAVTLAHQAGRNLARAARAARIDVALGYRGDSTLRGHYPAELWALRDAFTAEAGRQFDGELIVPFFEEGGRFTIGDVHFVQQANGLVPAAETEFARDAAFGYRSSYLPAWIEEKTAGRIAAEAVASLSIETLRLDGPERVADVLGGVSGGVPVVVNAASYRDLEVLVLGLLRAEARGKRFIYRTAASFARVRAGLGSRPLVSADELYSEKGSSASAGGLTIVGSHVRRTTEQLERALQVSNLEARELPVERLLDPAVRFGEVAEAAEWIERRYLAGVDVLAYTSRETVSAASAEASLRLSQTVSAALVELAGRLRAPPRYLIAKGGITASDLATRAFGVRRARVPGQVAAGVPCWILGAESRFPGVPYVIFPGNVGTPRTLADVISLLRAA
ncbi:MAG TPA: four-carbon acid sugar kinase family protein [Chloroflexota bacterium]|nr:four-carbon acid sugar kinase family protein [Chloroflexota bacterium]